MAKQQNNFPQQQNNPPEQRKKLSRKERKIQEKEKRHRQDELEKRLVAEGAISRRVKYMRRSFLWNLFAIVLTFLFGMLIAIGGLLGVGYYATSRSSMRSLLSLFGVSANDLLREEYTELTAYGLMRDFLTTLSNAGDEGFTLSSIDKYTPVLANALNNLSDSLSSVGVTLEVDKMMAEPISSMGDFFRTNVVDTIVLGKTLGLTRGSNSMMLAICYGSEGDDYIFDEEGNVVMLEGKHAMTLGELSNDEDAILDRVEVEDALGADADSNASVKYLAYGTLGVHYDIIDGEIVMRINPYTGEKFQKKKLSDLTDDESTALDDAKISDLIDIGDSKGILFAIRDWTVSDLRNENRVKRLRVGQILTDKGDSHLMRAISDWRIGDLSKQDKINSLTLGDVMVIDENSPRILRTLRTTTIGDLGNRINSIRLKDILEDEDIRDNKLLRNLADSSLESLSADVLNVSVRDVYGESVYSHMWYDKNNSYKDIIAGFNPAVQNSPIPNKIPSTEGMQFERGMYLNDEKSDTQLKLGWFAQRGNAYALFEENVFTRKDIETKEITRYTEIHLPLTPIYDWSAQDSWSVYNYDEGRPDSLPAGDDIDISTEGYEDGVVPDSTGTPLTDNAGHQLYYRTTVEILPEEEDEDQSITVRKFYYALMEDDFGIYYIYITPKDYKGVRVDLERAPVAYEAEGEQDRLSVETDGAVTYRDKQYTVYTAGAVYGEEDELISPAYNYIKVEEDLLRRYYVPQTTEEGEPAYEYATVYTKEETEERVYATWEDGGEIKSRRAESYLAGTWFLLFGKDVYIDSNGEECDPDDPTATRTVTDISTTPVLEIDALLNDTTRRLNSLALWELYLHEVIEANPFKILTPAFEGKGNLNLLNITQLIEYITATV